MHFSQELKIEFSRICTRWLIHTTKCDRLGTNTTWKIRLERNITDEDKCVRKNNAEMTFKSETNPSFSFWCGIMYMLSDNSRMFVIALSMIERLFHFCCCFTSLFSLFVFRISAGSQIRWARGQPSTEHCLLRPLGDRFSGLALNPVLFCCDRNYKSYGFWGVHSYIYTHIYEYMYIIYNKYIWSKNNASNGGM